MVVHFSQIGFLAEQPPCQDSNLDHRLMACPRMDKVDRSLPVGRDHNFDLVDYTPARTVEVRGWERADYLPACKGSVDSLATRTCPCPELAAASTLACHSHVYEGSTYPERQHDAFVHSPP